jgi:5-methylcytosine-specific restriction endonuclease McrA
MRLTEGQVNEIFDRTSGKCHLCHKKLSFKNYARYGERGAWEVEHSVPRACGGSDRLNNLYAACISCNRAKGARTTRSIRLRRGLTRAPMSANTREAAKRWNALGGGLLGIVPGAMLLGPPGAVLGAALGAVLGHDRDPDNG